MTTEVSLLRIWFLNEEQRFGPLNENIWINHQLSFESLWAFCGILGVSLIFASPVWFYSSLTQLLKAKNVKSPLPQFLFIIPLLNLVFIFLSTFKVLLKTDLGEKSPYLTSLNGVILSFCLPFVALIHSVLWLMPYYDLEEYLVQAYLLVVLGLIQLVGGLWQLGWIKAQQKLNIKLIGD